MKVFLSIAAVLAWLFGIALLLAPAKFYDPAGIAWQLNLTGLVVLQTLSLGAGAAVTPGVLIHVVLGSLFAYFLLKVRRSSR